MNRRRPTSMTKDSEIALVAQQIREAAQYLMKHHHVSLEQLRNITAGGNQYGRLPNGRRITPGDRLHKNSVMKIKDLRVGWAVLVPVNDHGVILTPEQIAALGAEVETLRRRWHEAAVGAVGLGGRPGRWQWMWNPQVDTFEKLERIIGVACAHGFVPDARLSLYRAVATAA